MMQPNLYNPDVLTCLANLSNDEVFTPPQLANQMLDMLPQELFESTETTFLDPCCKSGVFLREIAKRLIKGLEQEIPDLQDRLNHIYTKQLFGIAITELTALLSRRSTYCSKHANGKYSICSAFKNEEGNIQYERVEHTWENGRCIYCGASQSEYDRDKTLETHAYQFIHNPKELKKMKFDVIVGNPPYQLSVGNESGNKAKAKAIYQHFIDQAEKLNPRYLTMIVPSRWMTRTAEGIQDEWVDKMLNDKRIHILHDFLDANECFPGVDIKGGVCYFLWDRDYKGKCEYFLHSNDKIISNTDYLNAKGIGIVIRDIQAQGIVSKIEKIEGNYLLEESNNFSGLVSPKDFFTNKQKLTSIWDGFEKEKTGDFNIKYYLNKNIHKLRYGWVMKGQIPKNHQTIPLHKVYIPSAAGSGNDTQVLSFPFYGEPNSVCSQTYLVIGYDPTLHNFTKEQCENIISYIKTRFFRYLVSIKKKTQNGPRGVYQFVPLQDFNETWTDEKLYKKYGLTQEEIDFIESMIRPME